MGIVVRQSFKTLVTTYIGLTIGYFNALWLYPLFLSKEEIGLARILVNLAFLFATFASLGAANIPYKFFPYFNDKEKGHNGFLFLLLIIGSFGFILFTIIFIAAKDLVYSVFIQNSPQLLDYYYYLLPFTFIALYYSIFESYIVIQQRPVLPNFIKEVFVRFLIAAGLLGISLKLLNFQGYIILIILSYFMGLVILIIYTWRQKILFIKADFSVFKNKLLTPILGYGGFVLLGNSSSLFISNIDSLMLSAYKGLGATGIYTIAFLVATVIEIPKRSISQSVIGIVSEANKNNDHKQLEIIYKKSSINQLIIGGLVFIGIWCNVENIFNIMPNSEIYIAGKWVVFFIGLSKLFDVATGVNAEILSSSKFYKADLLFLVILGITAIITNIIFIPLLGITGAALASAISVLLVNSIRFIFIFMKFKIQPFTLNTIKVLAISGLVLLINYLIPNLDNILLDILIRSITILLSFGGLIILLKPSEDIEIILNKIFSRIFHGK